MAKTTKTSTKIDAAKQGASLDLMREIDRHSRVLYVHEAIEMSRPANHRGVKSELWKQSDGTLIDIAVMHLIDGVPVPQIFVKHKRFDKLDITVKQVERWMPGIREKYNDLIREYLAHRRGAAIKAMSGGDLDTLNEMFFGTLGAQLLAELHVKPISKQKPMHRYAFLRFAEGLADASKAQRANKLIGLKIEQLAAVVGAAKAEAERREKKSGRAMSNAEVFDLIAEMAGLKDADASAIGAEGAGAGGAA